MATPNQPTRTLLAICLGCLLTCIGQTAAAEKFSEPKLSERGEKIQQNYAQMLEKLSKEIAAELPEVEGVLKSAFLASRAEELALKEPAEDAGPEAHKAYHASKASIEAKVMESARALLSQLAPQLTDDNLDAKLMRVAILRHGTPAGLAEFAQQSDAHQALIEQLLADESLMKQVLVAGGANGGEYGEAMQVYRLILDASEKAREPGILQNLALGTALHQPWLEGTDRGSVSGLVFTDHQTPDGQVARYFHYEQAYLKGELDPAFKDFTAWECRYITNDPHSNEELTWAREMLRNFRPDHVTNPDHSWRYVAMVKSDFPYCSTRHDPSLGLSQQEALALGGICGRRAFFGRFITRAFGIPARRSTQTGHAAMNMWTPDGWVTRLGAWWSLNWCGPWGGLDFYLESQAREYEDEYIQVLRAQWIGDALGEEEVSLRQYGQGGGFWNALAFYKKRILVADNAAVQAAAEAELAALTADEARLLGESDKILGSEREVEKVEIPDAEKIVTTADDGTITIPAVACVSPDSNTEKVLFMDSFSEGMQIHYQRLGSRPEILRYYLEVPADGKYEIRALVSTVSPEGLEVTYRINRRTIVETQFPYTKGMWQQTKAEEIELREGRNSIMLTLRAPNRGVSISSLQLKPLK
jgi:hypothetical protein